MSRCVLKYLLSVTQSSRSKSYFITQYYAYQLPHLMSNLGAIVLLCAKVNVTVQCTFSFIVIIICLAHDFDIFVAQSVLLGTLLPTITVILLSVLHSFREIVLEISPKVKINFSLVCSRCFKLYFDV